MDLLCLGGLFGEGWKESEGVVSVGCWECARGDVELWMPLVKF